MRMKKFVAIATAVAMVLASTGTVFASSELETPTGTGGGTVTGDSTYVDTVRYKVTLPTSDSLDFNIDPEGLYGFFSDPANSAATSVDGADLSAYEGKVASASMATVTNKSSIPVVVTCDFSIDTTADVTLKALSDTLDPKAKELALGVIPMISDGADTPAYTASENQLSVDSVDTDNPDSILFALDKADYEFTYDSDGKAYDYVQKAAADGVTDATYAYFKIGGNVSKSGDWSEIVGESAKTVNLDCVFSFVGASSITGAVDVDNSAVVTTEASITYLVTPTPIVTPEPTAAPTAVPTAAPTAAPTPTTIPATPATFQTIAVAGGAGTNLTSAYTVAQGIYVKVDSAFLTTSSTKLGEVKINGAVNTPLSLTGNSSGNGNGLYFKLATGTVLHAGDVITVVIDGTTYTYTVAN